MATKDADAFEGCAALVLAWCIGWLTGGVHAFVAMKGWEWFVADTFNVQELTLAQAWGLWLMVWFATMSVDVNKDRDPRPLYTVVLSAFTSVILSGFALSSFWVLSLYV